MSEQRRLVLCAVDGGLAEAWRSFCGDLPGVEVWEGSILDVSCDAVVSPANSFGFMDGGIDALYVQHLGSEIERAVRRMIIDRHGGELPVGLADIVATGRTPANLIVAPTMRVPMRLVDSTNPYQAARAVFRLMTSDDPRVAEVRSIAMPGLGTGVGQVGANTCAHQVAAAYRDIVMGEFEPPATWVEASHRHQSLYTDQPRRLQ